MASTQQLGNVHRGMLRSVATLELAKGLLVLLVGFGIVSLARRGLDLADIAGNCLGVLHLNPEWHLSKVFRRAAARLEDTNLVLVAAVAAAYSAMRFVESYGLWKQRAWAEWIALISGALYLPLEIYELSRRASVAKWALFLLNLAIVIYMAYLRVKDRKFHDRERRLGRGSEELG